MQLVGGAMHYLSVLAAEESLIGSHDACPGRVHPSMLLPETPCPPPRHRQLVPGAVTLAVSRSCLPLVVCHSAAAVGRLVV